MEVSLESPVDEVTRLRGCLNDLVSTIALPALWAGGEPLRIVSILLDALLEMLRLTVVVARVNDPESGKSIDVVRLAESLQGTPRARRINEAIRSSFGEAPAQSRLACRLSDRDVDLSIASARLGFAGEIGIVIAGSERSNFPVQTERLVLDVAANQAAIGLQQSRLLSEQKRVAKELDERVARRTSELAAANERLTSEVAERRRAEDAVRDRERESRLIVDSIPGLIALLTATGDVEVVNRQALDYFGQTLEELRQWGGSTNDTVHPEDLPQVIDVFTRAIASGSPYEIVQRFKRSDGVYRWFLNSGFPVLGPTGDIARWCVLLTDIDERKRAEDALRELQREMARAAQVATMGELAASIAHEVNQPLSGIITNTNTCLRMLGADPPNVDGARETARRTLRDGNRASDVIARLRALFSRKQCRLEAMDLNDATREVLALSLSDLQRNRVLLHSELADDLPPITGDRLQLQQVILNLVRNASDAMVGVDDRPRHLLVRTEREGEDRVRVTVRDAGVGVDPHTIDRLFDAFYTNKSDGMGIGLSVSRSIIQRHHGRIWASPNEGPGGGATFTFSIPCRPDELARSC